MKMPPCKRCGSKNTYGDSDGIGPVVACLMCGHRSGIQIVLPRKNEEEDQMASKGPCKNCNRSRSLVGGKCSVCRKAAKGKTGDELTLALEEIKRKIDNGEIRTRGVTKAKPAAGQLSAAKSAPRRKASASGDRIPVSVELAAEPDEQEVPVTLRLTIGIRIVNVAQVEA